MKVQTVKRLALYGFVVDLLILFVLCLTLWPIHPAEAQLAASSGFSYKHISTATNTQMMSASGILHTVVINGGTAGAITVKDTTASDCSGGVTIAVVATLTGSSAQTLAFDLQTTNGLCVTTAAATDVTVSYR